MENKHINTFENFNSVDDNITTDKLVDFFEEEGFNVNLSEEDGVEVAEVEKWADGGVDMIFILEPFTKESFIERVNEFDIDEEIDLHRQGEAYKRNFTITQSVEDFTNFHKYLKGVVYKLEQL